MNSAQVEKIISIATTELGTKESPPNSNSVKYNDWYYGRKISGSAYPWCMVFVMWVFNKAGLSNLIYGGKKTASCTTLMNYAKQNNLFYASNFRRGDLALFDFDNDKRKSEHIGIITEVKSGSVVTIEGNTSSGNDSDGGEVQRRTRSNSLIIGVYRPDYEEDIMTYEDFKKYMEQYRAELSQQPATLTEFNDAKQAGITDGSRPRDFVTREEAAVMAVRAGK